jgi:hypothetical protein
MKSGVGSGWQGAQSTLTEALLQCINKGFFFLKKFNSMKRPVTLVLDTLG